MNVIVVGGGLAGLTCAKKLLAAGVHVTVVEASDGVGGRARSDNVDGYTLDRGFQVLFDSYPAVRRNLDIDDLFARGAIIFSGGTRTTLTDPRRTPDFGLVASGSINGAMLSGERAAAAILAD